VQVLNQVQDDGVGACRMMGSIVKDGMVYSLTQGLGLDPLRCQKTFFT
jgi:hypothetical protein